MNKKDDMRVTPHSLEAEKAVLGCMLLNKEAVSKALQVISEESFFNSSHAKIFKAMVDLFEKGKTIDNLTLIDHLNKKNLLKEVGDSYFITGLTNEAPSAGNIEYYANIVKDKFILRTIISSAIDMSQGAYEDSLEPIEILENTQKKIFELTQKSQKGEFVALEPLLADVLEDWGNKDVNLIGIQSGFTDIDATLSGFQKSDLIILAGRPSMGKTALALAITRNASLLNGKKVGLFSLEMSKKQIAERFITSESRVDSHLVKVGKLPKEHWKRLSQAADNLNRSQIYIDDSPGINIMEIRAKARQLKAEKDIDLLIVDYLQLINAGIRIESRQQEISYISRSLKSLAKELDIPVICLSQLSRAVENRTNHRPIMSDLRESGAIEQDADVIMFIYRKFVYTESEEDAGMAEVIIAKHRNGPTGSTTITFLDKFARFENYAHSNRSIEDIPLN